MSRTRTKKPWKFGLYFGILLTFVLCSIGIGYAAWTDELKLNLAVETAQYRPQVEISGVHRTWMIKLPVIGWVEYSKDFPVSIGPAVNEPITVTIGHGHILTHAVPGDRYRFNFKVTNRSDIPIQYRTVNNLSGLQAGAVNVQPGTWRQLEPGQSNVDNWAEIYVSHIFFSPCEIAIGGDFFRNFAVVEMKQFNSNGWSSKVPLSIDINGFVPIRL